MQVCDCCISGPLNGRLFGTVLYEGDTLWASPLLSGEYENFILVYHQSVARRSYVGLESLFFGMQDQKDGSGQNRRNGLVSIDSMSFNEVV